MTNLPLRPDGGIDWEEVASWWCEPPDEMPMFKSFVAATLERVAKWHEEQEAECSAQVLVGEKHGLLESATIFAAHAVAHQKSAATIRAMKP